MGRNKQRHIDLKNGEQREESWKGKWDLDSEYHVQWLLECERQGKRKRKRGVTFTFSNPTTVVPKRREKKKTERRKKKTFVSAGIIAKELIEQQKYSENKNKNKRKKRKLSPSLSACTTASICLLYSCICSTATPLTASTLIPNSVNWLWDHLLSHPNPCVTFSETFPAFSAT